MSILTTAISGSYPDIAVNFYVTLLGHCLAFAEISTRE
jgi:hypothetical protein